MSRARLLFTTTDHPASALIRTLTWSSWSHVALVDGDDVVEATAPDGVRRVSMVEAIKNAKRGVLVELPCQNPAAVIAAAMTQLGKPYDYTAVAGIGFRRDWQKDDAWFCSELIAWAFDQAGEPLFRREVMRRVVPEHLWMLAPLPPPPEISFFTKIEGRHERPSSF